MSNLKLVCFGTLQLFADRTADASMLHAAATASADKGDVAGVEAALAALMQVPELRAALS